VGRAKFEVYRATPFVMRASSMKPLKKLWVFGDPGAPIPTPMENGAVELG
jgi:hypothetical protein